MNYNIEKSEKNKATITISLSKETWQKELDNAYAKNKNKFPVVGFRAGKAPRKVVEKNYGDTVFFEEALSDGFYKYYIEILDLNPELEPVDNPHLEIKEISHDGLKLEATVELMPEVVIKKYKGFGIKIEPKAVTEKDVENELNKLVSQNTRLVESNEPVKLGDVANIDFEGSVDGKVFEGGTSQGYDLEIGSKSFIDNFEEQLVGLTVGAKKDVKVTFPTDYQSTDLAGKDAVFKVKINAVKVKELPQLNDELISNTTQFESIDEFKENAKKDLAVKFEKDTKIQLETKILDELLKNIEVELPKSIVDHEVEHIVGDFEMRLMYQGLNLEQYCQIIGTTVEKFKQDRLEDAVKNVKLQLALRHVMDKEDITLSDKEVDQKLEEMAKLANKTLKEYKQLVDDHSLSHIKNDILMGKLLEFMVTHN